MNQKSQSFQSKTRINYFSINFCHRNFKFRLPCVYNRRLAYLLRHWSTNHKLSSQTRQEYLIFSFYFALITSNLGSPVCTIHLCHSFKTLRNISNTFNQLFCHTNSKFRRELDCTIRAFQIWICDCKIKGKTRNSRLVSRKDTEFCYLVLIIRPLMKPIHSVGWISSYDWKIRYSCPVWPKILGFLLQWINN